MYPPNLKSVALPVPEIIGGTQKIWAVPWYVRARLSPKFLMDFYSDWPCKCTRQIWSPWDKRGSSVANPPISTIGGRGWYHLKERWWVPISPSRILFLYQHSFARNFRLQFSVGVENPNLGEGEAVEGRGWYRSEERWWVSIAVNSNFSSIFTRSRDIAAFVLLHATFSLPHL